MRDRSSARESATTVRIRAVTVHNRAREPDPQDEKKLGLGRRSYRIRKAGGSDQPSGLFGT